jgi:maltose O-acetyltransferase
VRTKIGDPSYIGLGAAMIDGISIGSNSIVGTDAVVTKDIPSFVQAFGVPARVVKRVR